MRIEALQQLTMFQFVNLLVEKSGLNLTELAERIGISVGTLHNWKSESVDKIDYKIRGKLAQAIDKNNWGFTIKEFAGNKIIVVTKETMIRNFADESIIKENDELKDTVYKLTKELFKLQEKIQQYEVKK